MGSSGLIVSVVGLGGNNFGSRVGLDETRAVVDAALDVGVTLVDTADTEAIARRKGSTRYISAQNSYSLLDRGVERELMPACVHYGIGVLPYFPLASGVLTGKYRRGEAPAEGTRLAARGHTVSERQFDVLDALEQFARERGITLLHVAIGALAA